MDEKKRWHFNVEATVPWTWTHGEQKREGTKNVNLAVVAGDVDEVLALCRERYADITFLKIMRDRHVEAVLIGG